MTHQNWKYTLPYLNVIRIQSLEVCGLVGPSLANLQTCGQTQSVSGMVSQISSQVSSLFLNALREGTFTTASGRLFPLLMTCTEKKFCLGCHDVWGLDSLRECPLMAPPVTSVHPEHAESTGLSTPPATMQHIHNTNVLFCILIYKDICFLSLLHK